MPCLLSVFYWYACEFPGTVLCVSLSDWTVLHSAWFPGQPKTVPSTLGMLANSFWCIFTDIRVGVLKLSGMILCLV